MRLNNRGGAECNQSRMEPSIGRNSPGTQFREDGRLAHHLGSHTPFNVDVHRVERTLKLSPLRNDRAAAGACDLAAQSAQHQNPARQIQRMRIDPGASRDNKTDLMLFQPDGQGVHIRHAGRFAHGGLRDLPQVLFSDKRRR